MQKILESYEPKNIKKLKTYIKMKKAAIKFSDIEIEKQKFHQ